jgi:hypothetical protein
MSSRGANRVPCSAHACAGPCVDGPLAAGERLGVLQATGPGDETGQRAGARDQVVRIEQSVFGAGRSQLEATAWMGRWVKPEPLGASLKADYERVGAVSKPIGF